MRNTLLWSIGLSLLLSTAAFAGITSPSVPEPGTGYLLGTAVLGGLGVVGWKRRKKK
jgi:hypothetical protein